MVLKTNRLFIYEPSTVLDCPEEMVTNSDAPLRGANDEPDSGHFSVVTQNMTIVGATDMYFYAMCPSRECKGELVVEFDNHDNPTIVTVKCSLCGFVVAVLGGLEDTIQPQVPTPISFGNTKEELISS